MAANGGRRPSYVVLGIPLEDPETVKLVKRVIKVTAAMTVRVWNFVRRQRTHTTW